MAPSMKGMKALLKKNGSFFPGKKESRFLNRKAERKEDKILKERLKTEKNTQCSWWHWVFLVSAVTDQTGMLDVGGNPGDFDDDKGGGLSRNAHYRALLMQKLDRSGTASRHIIVGNLHTRLRKREVTLLTRSPSHSVDR